MTIAGSDQYTTSNCIDLDAVPFALTKAEAKEIGGEWLGSTIYELWATVAKRQYYWQKASFVCEYANTLGQGTERMSGQTRLRKMFDRLQKQACNVHIDTLHQVIDGIEHKVLQRRITTSVNPYSRMSFWRFVQMRDEGETPSDLLATHNCEQSARAQLAAEVKMREILDISRKKAEAMPAGPEKELAKLAHAQANAQYHHQRYHHHFSSQPVIEQSQAPSIREWVRLYYLAGHKPTHGCTVERRGEVTYLSQPIDMSGPKATMAHRSLRYWSRYGIMGLKDIKVLPAGAPELLFPLQDFSALDQERSSTPQARRHRSKSTGAMAREALGLWPEAYLPSIPLITERIPSGWTGLSNDLTQEQMNALELEFFDQVITKGEVFTRGVFWGQLNAQYRQRMECLRTHLPVTNALGRDYVWELSVSARGYLLAGLDPETKVKPLAFGRGGVYVPREASDSDKSLAWYVSNALPALNEHFDDYDYDSVYEAHLF